jgi:hypothetical protein
VSPTDDPPIREVRTPLHLVSFTSLSPRISH